MKKIAPAIAGALLGLLFIMVSVMFLFHLGPKMPPPVPGSTNEAFMTAFEPTG
ncbi:MAG: hypothetical protein JWO82_952, partial [Akkermansiaceae bacterium]|nr:hypothetical protein [Akkermansiaceae bacterium]